VPSARPAWSLSLNLCERVTVCGNVCQSTVLDILEDKAVPTVDGLDEEEVREYCLDGKRGVVDVR
jgi:hypothetical protein